MIAASADRNQRDQEFVQCAHEVMLGGRRDAAVAHRLSGDDAEVEQDFAKHFLDRQKRIEQERREARHVQPLED